MIKIDGQKEKRLEIVGGLSEVSAECVMIMRAIYKKNLEIFPEPEIASGILMNMVVKAMMSEIEDMTIEELIFD